MTEEKKDQNSEDIEKNKAMASYSYIWIFSLYVYMIKKDSKFSQFHAKQGVILFFLSIATIIPGLGQILGIVLLFVSILGFVKAQNGEWYKIPFVYDLSKKINF